MILGAPYVCDAPETPQRVSEHREPWAGVTLWVIYDRWGLREPGLLWSLKARGEVERALGLRVTGRQGQADSGLGM